MRGYIALVKQRRYEQDDLAASRECFHSLKRLSMVSLQHEEMRRISTQLVKTTEIRAVQGAGAFSTGAYYAYVTEKSTPATKKCDVYTLFYFISS